ncbi:MAG: SIMPL domain-containing protein [Gemmatimonadales bacterium]|jgi:uncharacterized protein YggE
MFRRLTTGFLALSMLSASAAAAQSVQSTGSGPALVMASGLGEVMLQPDRATVSITVRTIADRPDDASSRNRSAAESVAAALAALDLDSLRSSGVRIGPNRQYTSDGPREEGYFAERSLRVSTDDLAQVGVIIEAALGAGATEIDNVAYSSSEEDSARREALAKAVANARSDAAAVAEAAGGRLGDVVLLSTGGVNVPRHIVRGFTTGRTIQGGRPNEMAVELPGPEDLTITANVEVHWAFEVAE